MTDHAVDQVTEPVTFHSDGLKLEGSLDLPSGTPEAVYPTIVTCAGWGGTKERTLPGFSALMTKAGFAVFRFDFRGYGASEGDRNRLYPNEQAADIRAAVAFIRSHPRVDASRVAAIGLLTGAAAALQAAADDRGIRAVVCLFPFGDGERWMRSLRRQPEWLEFQARLDADRADRARSGMSEAVDPNEILIRDSHGLEREARSRAASPARREWQLGLDSADAIIAFKPEYHVHRISPRAVMFVAVEDDSMAPFDDVERLYAKLIPPKRLMVLRGIHHHDIYQPEHLSRVADGVATFLAEAMRGDGD